MKLAKGITLLGMALILAGATGCKKRMQDVTPLPGYEASQAGKVGQPGEGGAYDPSTVGAEGNIPMTGAIPPDWIEDRVTFAAQTVYFDFDKSNVKPSEVPKLQSVSSQFSGMPNRMLRIEGHCDERGTEEYNRALGERRALSVREFLATLGVSPNRVETVSFGEDRPADPGHSEGAWSKNRRGEIIVFSPPGSAGGP
jgi:peptidoglycan-associated lipoprotein